MKTINELREKLASIEKRLADYKPESKTAQELFQKGQDIENLIKNKKELRNLEKKNPVKRTRKTGFSNT